MEEVRSGQLESACKALDQRWAASGAMLYTHSQDILLKHEIGVWRRSTYNRIRFLRWLFKAEGMSVEMDPKEWDVLTGMGSGAKAGIELSGIASFDAAQRACAELRKLPAASGATYDLDDLACRLWLSQHKRSTGRS